MATFLFLLDLLGMLSGIGGGIVHDLLVARMPVVLQAELYAVAALLGGGVVAAAHALHLPQPWGVAIGATLCLGLRFVAIRYGWHLPVARPPEQ
ncbi:hypothetical protein ATB53_16655 [Xanthomonas translucens]|uniref:Glycine transporter domain-containing protein n=1 Tax=Xanthomonas campestris pv. translucens TaxID=343 RepID=A0A109HJ19_XANCT|nr:hypothetical protein ATB53_16655 [Xanthomonas translucens]QSQ33784.1 TRIC cation channel family protein [Xanthomonas translucens pv. translucens]